MDVYLDVNSQEYVLVLMKNGELVIWTFLKPAYQWKHLSIIPLCKGKGTQLVQCEYDNKAKLLVWCEKRSASQCCICTTQLCFGDRVTITSTKALLHNCLPMNIYMLSNSLFCLMPVLNKPPGLLLFWSAKTDAIKVSENTMTRLGNRKYYFARLIKIYKHTSSGSELASKSCFAKK